MGKKYHEKKTLFPKKLKLCPMLKRWSLPLPFSSGFNKPITVLGYLNMTSHNLKFENPIMEKKEIKKRESNMKEEEYYPTYINLICMAGGWVQIILILYN